MKEIGFFGLFLPFTAKKLVLSFISWENLQHANLLTVLSDLYFEDKRPQMNETKYTWMIGLSTSKKLQGKRTFRFHIFLFIHTNSDIDKPSKLSDRTYRYLFLSVASTLFLHDADYVSSCKLENNQLKKGRKELCIMTFCN